MWSVDTQHCCWFAEMDPDSLFSSMYNDFGQDMFMSPEESLDMNFGLNDLFSNDLNFNMLQSDDTFTSMLHDELIDTFDFSLNPNIDTFMSNPNDTFFGNTSTTRNTFASSRTNSKVSPFNSLSVAKNSSPKQTYKANSLVNKSATNIERNARTMVKVNVPKVYISSRLKNSGSASSSGTSILLKSKKPKRRSLLSKSKQTKNAAGHLNSAELARLVQRDHNYCFLPDCLNSTKSSTSTITTSSEAQNDFDDVMGGFVSEDVMFNELPNFLQDLVDMDLNSITPLDSQDVLDGLNDACNTFADQYMEDLFGQSTLPNLNITEEDLNAIVDGGISSSSSSNSNSADHKSANAIGPDETTPPSMITGIELPNGSDVIVDTEVDIALSPVHLQMSDPVAAAMVAADIDAFTTGTEESSDDTDTSSSSSPFKPKRHRSLSGSSLNSRRKRRISSRSSVNSSDSMSEDTSSPESACSSRSSSPERALGLSGFSALTQFNLHNAMNQSKYHHMNKQRLRKHVKWPNSLRN